MTVLYIQVAGGDTVMFDHSVTIGRGSDRHHPDLVIDDPHVSTLHAAFTHVDGIGWLVQDGGSTNGTWRNDVTADGRFTYSPGCRVHGPVLLRRGDKIRVGTTILTCVPT